MTANTTALRFVTVASTTAQTRQARLLIESLRAFGGQWGQAPVWIFLKEVGLQPDFSGLGDVSAFPLLLPPPFRGYPLADKVFACARAEEMAGADAGSLVWLNLDCLIVNPPALFDLGQGCDAAFRPVHIRNVGSPYGEPPDAYWQAIYRQVGVEDAAYSVESFVDGQVIRPYYNTHCFSIRPQRELLRAWREHFEQLVTDRAFQAGPCRDELHQVFLHQAVLSALVMKSLGAERIRDLPPEYSYPLHLQDRLPVSRRPGRLNDLVCLVYEDTSPLDGLAVDEPLKTWLTARR